MSEIDEIFGDEKTPDKKSFNKDDWIAKKAQDRENAYGMLEEATNDLSSPEKLTQYLSVQSRFDRYSVSNAILVAHQKPEAKKLGDYNYWKKQNVYIQKGEKAITILEPGEYTKQSGEKGLSYNAKKVFDISQTDAEIKPERSKSVDDKKLIKALLKSTDTEVLISDSLPEDVNAQYNGKDNVIYIRQGMEGSEIFRNLAREIAVARFDKSDMPKEEKAISVFCVTFILCKRNGIEPPPCNVKSELFTDKNPKDIRALLSKTRDEANTISAVMEKTLSPKNREAR